MRIFFRIATWTIAGGLLIGCNDQDDYAIQIERETRVVRIPDDRQSHFDGWKELENGMLSAEYAAPTSFLFSYQNSSPGDPVDPFASPVPSSHKKIASAQEILEGYGIIFQEGASASYNPATGRLVVVQTRDQMELVEAIVQSGCDHRQSQVHIRVEIYQVSAFSGIQILDSLRLQGEHTPERDAVLRAAKEGGAQLLAAPTILARSGQRAKTEELISDPDHSGLEETLTDQDSETESKNGTNSRQLPTLSLEVDPIIGGDEYTLDANFRLTLRDREDLDYSREMTTCVTMHNGDWIFIGNWKAANPGEMMLVFMNGTIQILGDEGHLVEKTEVIR